MAQAVKTGENEFRNRLKQAENGECRQLHLPHMGTKCTHAITHIYPYTYAATQQYSLTVKP